MADYDYNPYSDGEAANPFADPSVQQATQPTQRPPGLDEYNPFADSNTPTTTAAPAPTGQQPTQQAMPPPQPAVMQPAVEQPPPYSASQQAATEDLKRRQEELEIKAAELARKEQEMQRNMAVNARANNFPPLPSKCPVQPCFYQDISVDIPLEFQRTVKMVYYSWIAYVVLLFLNVIGSLAYFIASTQNSSVSGKAGVTFGVSILFLVLFTPCSFVCWFRPVYKAFRTDSSLNFFVFFFIFFFQFCSSCLFAIGIDGFGTVGWLSAFGAVANNTGAGVIMFICAALFTVHAIVTFTLLLKIHRIYRRTGASFEKAQAEFGQGVASNKTVQNTATNVASAAVRNQFSGDNRY